MTTIPHFTDPRLTNWRKILQRYQNQPGADSRNNLKLSEPLRRVQVKVLKAMARSQGNPYNLTTLRRLEVQMIRAVLQAPITIIVQPSNGVANGSTVTFTVAATGGSGTLSYQWQKNGSLLANGGNISGATTTVLTVTSATTADVGSYRCLVTDSSGNFAFSSAASLVAAATDWSTRVVTNGGAAPSAANVTALQTFYDGLVADGLLSKIIALNAFAPDNLIACLTPLIVGPGLTLWTNNNFVAGDLTVNGLVGNGTTKYLDTGLNLTSFTSTIGNAIYAFTHTAASTDTDCGTVQNGTGHLLLDTAFTISRNGIATNNDITVAAQGPGFMLDSRVSTTDHRLYFANSGSAWAQLGATDVNNPGVALSVLSLFIFAYHDFTGSPNSFSHARISFHASVQNFSSSDGQKLFNRVQALRTVWGGGFV